MPPAPSSAVLQVVQADITTLDVGAIVNAANTSLLGGGGVDGAIHRAAGPALLAHCRTLHGCPTGQARITPGFGLPARHVIHAVGPVWHGGHRREPELLASCYRQSLELAREAGVRSIAFPSISTGVYRYPFEAAAAVAIATARAELQRHPDAFDRIIFCCFSERDARIYRQLLSSAEQSPAAHPPQAGPAASTGSPAAVAPLPVAWPHPRLIAHRGAGRHAPENTLAAFGHGARHGYRMFEFDVKLSSDGIPYCLHDHTLERTTNGSGPVAQLDWATLSALDAGAWHSPGFAGQRLPSLDAVLEWLHRHGLAANVEIKPVPGRERDTGTRIGRRLQAWADSPGAVAPVVTSFSEEALAASIREAPQLVHGLLLGEWHDDWLARVSRLGCACVVFDHRVLDEPRVRAVGRAGIRLLAYTVNDPDRVRELLAWGVDSVITDEVERIAPTMPAPDTLR